MARTSQNSSNRALERYVPAVEDQGGILTYYPVVINNSLTVNGAVTSTGASVQGVTTLTHSPVAINATATATAAQVATGYITSTSAAATTITLPTATALATQLGAVQGTVFDLFIDNTAGANTVTIAAGSGMTASAVAQVATYGVPTFGLMTVPSGTSGQGQFRFVFSSATACTYARVF